MRNRARLSRDAIQQQVEVGFGIPCAEVHSYALEYRIGSTVFYIKKFADRFPLVVHPDWDALLRNTPVTGVSLDKALYKNTSLKAFPKTLGPQFSNCGVDVEVADVEALAAVLQRIGAGSWSKGGNKLGAESGAESVDTLIVTDGTEFDALIKARIGQGTYRAGLDLIWSGKCAVTGIGIRSALRASHIKPWRDCSDAERLDVQNGFLLVATLDALFDAGLISFADDGLMLLASEVIAANPAIQGTSPPTCLRQQLTPAQQSYLASHRRRFGFG